MEAGDGGAPAPFLGSMCSGSKGSSGSKIMTTFNCSENRWRIKLMVV
jgi:hypothetical protein